MSKLERRYLISLFVSICLLSGLYLASVIYFLVECFQGNEPFNNNIFELIYIGVHAIILAVAFSLSFKAIKNDPFILNSLTYGEGKVKSKKASIIAIIFFFIGLAMFIYGLLLFLKVDIKDFGFPLGLKVILMNVGLFILILALYFYFYPHYHERGKIENK